MGDNNDLPKAYEPQQFEDEIYATWEQSGFFNPDTCIDKGVTDKNAEAFSIVLPPPNVTGTLHMGHAVMLAIQDVMTRTARMQGKKALWIPGTDHAAIATQSKVEKILDTEEGKTRYDVGREDFLKRVEAFAQESHDTIVNQSKKMGASLDWSREAYTLDEPRSLAVRTAFKKMYDDKLIYRGDRIVNWDPNLRTTVSDDEVEYKDEKAKFYYFQYGPFVIGTARPETKFGDKYIVMHPEDDRYKEYKHGQKLKVEWINGEIEATIIKDEAAEMEFGTGVMTITPWHSDVDFDLAEKHSLDREQIIDFDGKLLPIAQEFAGMHISVAREKIVEKLDKKGLLTKIDEEYEHRLATNSRGGGIIEPQVKRQWFVDVHHQFKKGKSLKSEMQRVVKNGDITIKPDRFNKIYFHWIDNLRDWCISRQIWFGHNIPAYYCLVCQADEIDVKLNDVLKKKDLPLAGGRVGALLQFMSPEEIKENMQWVEDVGEATPTVMIGEPEKCKNCDTNNWIQDPDTLDTWFSSGLWTFSTLGWPEQTEDLKTYHPTTVMETGYDIIFFWVARMILMTTYLLDDIPFKDVYLHGLIRDEKGRKMSKSLDNIINPLDMIEKFGTDATRLSLIIGISPGNDSKLSEEKVASFRNFTNKLYNISRFVLSTTEKSEIEMNQKNYDELSFEDQWIVGRLHEVTQSVTKNLETYEFARAADELKDFTWNEFADWYIEIAKIRGEKDAVLRYCLETLIKLWHPAMPFVTEHIWKLLGHDSLLIVETWPTTELKVNNKAIKNLKATQDIITAIRNLRAESNVKAAAKIDLAIDGADELQDISDIIKKLGRAGNLEIKKGIAKPKQCASAVVGDTTIYMSLEGLFDVDAEKERLTKEMEKVAQYISSLEKKLGNKEFVDNAPKNIVEVEQKKLDEAQAKHAKLEEQLKNLK